MPRSFAGLALIVMLFAAGCASQAEFLNNIKTMRRRQRSPAHNSR